MASEGVSPVSTAMQGQELKALLKETIRELLHEEPGLLWASDPSSASEKPHTGTEHAHGEFCTFVYHGVDGRPDGRSGVLGCNMNIAAASAPHGWPRSRGVATTTTTTNNWV